MKIRRHLSADGLIKIVKKGFKKVKEQLGQTLNLGGLIIIIVAVSGNFVAGYVYGQMSAGMKKAVQDRQLAAQLMASRFAADAARTRLVTEQTLDNIARQLPALAQQKGLSNGRAYLQHTMQITEEGDPLASLEAGQAEGVTPSLNGSGGNPTVTMFRGGNDNERKERKARPDKYCAYCEKRMSSGRSGRRKYCTTACKQAAYRTRQMAQT